MIGRAEPLTLAPRPEWIVRVRWKGNTTSPSLAVRRIYRGRSYIQAFFAYSIALRDIRDAVELLRDGVSVRGDVRLGTAGAP